MKTATKKASKSFTASCAAISAAWQSMLSEPMPTTITFDKLAMMLIEKVGDHAREQIIRLDAVLNFVATKLTKDERLTVYAIEDRMLEAGYTFKLTQISSSLIALAEAKYIVSDSSEELTTFGRRF